MLREFVSYLLLGLLAFVGIFVIVDVFEDRHLVDAGSPARLRFYVATSRRGGLILPVAVLLAASLGRFACYQAHAMRVAAQPLPHLSPSSLPRLERRRSPRRDVVPEANHRRKKIMDQEIKQRPSFPSRRQDVRYIGLGGRIYIIGSYDTQRQLMRDLVVQEFAGGTLARRIDARQGQWKDDHWELMTGYVRTFGGDSLDSERFDRLPLEVPERPEDFAKEERDPEVMGYAELRRWIERFRQSGGEAQPYLVDLHLKLRRRSPT
jgi:lipopolysaccharide export LptBFGC system permease protein LptF